MKDHLKSNIFAKQGFISVLALLSLIFMSAMLFVFQPEPEANVNKPIPVIVDTMKLQMEDISPSVEYMGRLEPSKKAELKFEINGKISKKFVEPGVFINSGEKILILEKFYIYKKLYELAKKNFELQTKEVERMKVLDKKSLLAKSQFDKTIQKQIELETLMYKSKQDFNKTYIEAKFSGVINDVKVDEGDTVNSNMIVANLIDTSQLDLYVEVRGDVIDALKLNMDIEIFSNGLYTTGKLISFQTSPNLETYTHLLRIRIQNKHLRSGMIATAKFILPKINNSFGVPVSSVLNDNGKKYIFLVNKKKLQKIEVNLITRFNEIYVVKGNVKTNDIIVTKDVASLSNNQEVLTSK
ncbi:MAG: efflux RND transporter periplasmic adaptor subunit [Gammaproteobacteria bacterium]